MSRGGSPSHRRGPVQCSEGCFHYHGAHLVALGEHGAHPRDRPQAREPTRAQPAKGGVKGQVRLYFRRLTWRLPQHSLAPCWAHSWVPHTCPGSRSVGGWRGWPMGVRHLALSWTGLRQRVPAHVRRARGRVEENPGIDEAFARVEIVGVCQDVALLRALPEVDALAMVDMRVTL